MICLNCGNTEIFKQYVYYKEVVREPRLIDGESEEDIDYLESETIDSEITDQEPPFCCKCKSTHMKVNLGKIELCEILMKHIRKDGTWSVEELNEEEYDPKLVQELTAMKV